ncbi:hypothetical protein CVT24_009940 [Panaeolus cyanescens]|uniref:DUF6534 domain-containing protein n=1 Tax=Panaeolus cyanescens TaxID=181874 RepID=A0A409VXJ2_9AGAR|nr:hypothetical protein CVT24_009940 [Panaeolus cyanescens]
MDADAMRAAFVSLVLPYLSALFIGTLVTWGLQGVLCVQVYNYHLAFPNDPLHMKALVYFSLCLELAQTFMVTSDGYDVYALGFGDVVNLDDLHLLWITLPILGGIVGLLCHLTFAYRLCILSRSKVVGAAITLLSLSASITAFTFGAKLFNAKLLSTLITVKHIYLVCGLWNGFGAACDALIAACMTFYLSRSQTGFRATDQLITRITRLTIETGLATATASIASAILFVGFRDKLNICVYFIVPAIMINKLYAITILATFNNRPHNMHGGAPALPDIENSFESEQKTFSRHVDRKTSGKEIRIGRTVVQQVWTDGLPVEHIEMYGEETASNNSNSHDESSPKKRSHSLTSPLEGDIGTKKH